MNTPVALSLDLLPANVAARIAYFVAHAGQGYYTHDDADAAAVVVIDGDALHSDRHLKQAREDGRTVLLLSSVLHTFKGGVMLGKPVSGQKLLQAALPLSLLQTVPSTHVVPEECIPVLKRRSGKAHVAGGNAAQQIHRPARPSAAQQETTVRVQEATQDSPWSALYGERDDAHVEDLSETNLAYYKPELTLAGHIKAALKVCEETGSEAAVLMSGVLRLYLDPADGFAFSNLPMHAEPVLQLARSSLATADVEIECFQYDRADVVRDTVGTQRGIINRLESVLWLSALFGSRGRLPEGVCTRQRLQLRYWPDMTRLELFPHAMELAARWLHRPLTLEQMMAARDVPPRYTIAFYNAALAIDAFEKLDEIAPERRAPARLSIVRQRRT